MSFRQTAENNFSDAEKVFLFAKKQIPWAIRYFFAFCAPHVEVFICIECST
jgi:hypothetical protein